MVSLVNPHDVLGYPASYEAGGYNAAEFRDLGDVVQRKLHQDVGPVFLDRLRTAAQFRSDIDGANAGSDAHQHLEFDRRQHLWGRRQRANRASAMRWERVVPFWARRSGVSGWLAA